MSLAQHPFLNGLQTIPEGKGKDLLKIRNWMTNQPHLPPISDEHIYLFLHACYYHQEKTKHTIEVYFTFKTNTPSLFANRDVHSTAIQSCLDIANIIRLPQLTPDGYKVLMYSLHDSDFTKMYFPDAIKGFFMFNDCIISEDGLTDGYIVCFDMKGVTLGHLARVSLPTLKAFMLYIQEAHPTRLKAVHILNTANYIHHIMRLVCPLIRSDLISHVKFHKGLVAEGLPLELMPEDYGGSAPSIATLNAESRELVYKYSQWFLDSESIKVDEAKRIKKNTFWGFLNGTNTTQSLEKQKANFLQNLQID